MRQATSTSLVSRLPPCAINPNPPASTKSTSAVCNLSTSSLRPCTRLRLPESTHQLQSLIMPDDPLLWGQTEIFLEQRHIDPVGLRPLDRGQTVIRAPEALQFRQQGYLGIHGKSVSVSTRFANLMQHLQVFRSNFHLQHGATARNFPVRAQCSYDDSSHSRLDVLVPGAVEYRRAG